MKTKKPIHGGIAKHGPHVFSAICAFLLAAMCLLLSGPAVSQAQEGGEETNVVPPEYAAQIPEEIRYRIANLMGSASLTMAKDLSITEIFGKDISSESESRHNSPKKLKDVGIGVHPTKHENEPTVAANPVDKKKMVAGSHFFGPPAPTANRCVAYTSDDHGATWSAPLAMPHLHPLSQCSDPVLAYAPDGSRVYYAYMDIKQIFVPVPPFTLTIDLDIVVSYSNDDGATWTGPVVALNGAPTIITFAPFSITPGFAYDKCWIGTHIDDSQSNSAYVSATRFDDFAPFACNIAFARSSNQSVSWSAPLILDSSVGGCGAGVNPVVQGSRPTGGVGGEVLVAWYNSGSDGWLNGSFRIRTRRSGNNGTAFDPVVNAAVDSFEAPFFLGPNQFYHRWWGTMFPDVEIDPGGEAHIIYTHDPAANPIPGLSNTAEDGDIRYVTSPGSPYGAGSWSAPETVNDDGLVRAQGYAALETNHGGQSSHLEVIWEDHRLSPNVPTSTPFQCFVLGICNSSNLRFDMFYSRKVPGEAGWRDNSRVSDSSSISDFVFIGDYNDLTVSNKLFAVWTDRRHRTSIFQFEDNVFGSQITPRP